MKTLAASIVAAGLVLGLSACGDSRMEPQGSFLDPVCMPDGSVVNNQLANPDGTFGDPRASHQNCPWYKNK
jgi:hypothetical protein